MTPLETQLAEALEPLLKKAAILYASKYYSEPNGHAHDPDFVAARLAISAYEHERRQQLLDGNTT